MTGVYTLKAPQPTISPTTSVTYAPGLTVTIDDPGYSIRYRINGGTEIDTSPPASFIINTSSSITAYAYIPGMDDSDITTATYAIDGTGPIVVLPTTPADDAYSVNTGSPIVITFNEEIDSGTVYVNTANNSCSVGTIQVSWDNFNNNTCAKFNNGVSPDVTKTIFTINPSSGELDFGTFYKIKVTTGVKDAYGNSMATEYAMTNGFLTDTMGVPDASFDSDGVATTALLGTDYGRAITVQPNNRIVVAGETGTYYGLVRYLPDGSLDTGEFQSPNGIFTDDFGGTSICTSVGILPANGTIVVAGHWYNGTDFNFGLAGYKMIDGYLDSMLNKKSYDLRLTGNDDQAYALAVDAMERFVVVGSSSNGSNDEFAVTRFMPDGTFDGSFNGGKIFEQFAPAVNNVAHAVAIDPGVNPSDPMDDRIITAGWFGFLANQNRFAIACYDNNGNLDTSFNGTGKRSENFGFGGNDEAYAVAVQSDHKIIVAGNTETAPLSSIYDFALVRYNTDGSIDTSFNGGKVTLDIGGYDRLTAIAIQRDGKIVVAGYTDTGTNPNNIVLVRLNSDGTLDSSFGPPTFTGIIITDLTAQPDIGTAMVLQPNGRIVIAGATNNGGDWDYLVMRYK
ncbi:MAG: hypothetical protein A2176_13825 [Spirochaetes bacterium RBG_13_51_14]|nr:MAG: hypothetical protein A2176_13825 [Spirochaetes bacterium RBG_13_51_14]